MIFESCVEQIRNFKVGLVPLTPPICCVHACFQKAKGRTKNAKIFEVLACQLNYSWRIRANICVNSREHKKPLKRGRLLSLFKPQKFNLVSTLLLLRNQRIFYCSKKSAFEIRQTAECFPKFNDLLESEWHDNSNHGMILKKRSSWYTDRFK